MKRWIFVLPLLAIALFILIPTLRRESAIESSGESWQVVRVSDGDTITVTQGDRKEKIRFCGVDANESQ
ncbi:MAG: hypothetical protein N4J56_007346 [Chroococcidiopsis sp. SAG 2025]|uniref:thermonuclease family protein n=1 Tax=Chroococcidiopsis sp. SAG 2025 TaxID=171389 RepID=UPI0029372ACC|nr:hypothetical protein [Chroococcidiopsis sp. SAG 2025]MDV2997641.1 hypothetical protein [Chroococcidiopsis sp. SAG 2025]